MDKAQLKKTQPVVYRTLSRALTSGRIAHAYMFAGPKSANTKNTALLFIQSLFCPHPDEDGFACQECDSCRRLAAHDAADVKWIEKERIKKNDIAWLQEQFSTTAVERNGKRVYVLDRFDKATPDSSNALLKFLEEPGTSLFGILLVENAANTLTTIQSRCQLIQFRPGSIAYVKNALKDLTDEESADMLARAGYSFEEAAALVTDETYPLICEEAKVFFENMHRITAVYRMQREVFPAKGEHTTKQWVNVWLIWLLYYIKHSGRSDVRFEQKVALAAIVTETLDLLVRPVDLALCLDKVYARIRKAVNL